MVVTYDTGDWLKKVHWTDAVDLIQSNYEGWDKVGQQPMEVVIDYKHEKGTDQQQDMTVWADDNSDGYFYSAVTYTESGTVVAHAGDKISILFVFQNKEDATAFKLRWT